MIVDDDEVNLLLAQEVVKFLGAVPIAYVDPEAALKGLLTERADIVFMDLHMPGISGLELTQRIRQAEVQLGSKRVPIVALTASAMPNELARCLESGMDDTMTKPFSFEDLRAKLDHWCPRP